MGSALPLNTEIRDQLICLLDEWASHSVGPLGGRAPVKHVSMGLLGPVVIKSYRRGGMMARLTRDRFTRVGKTRSRREFEFLTHAARAGVTVPTPLIHVSEGFPFYRAWLVTREINGHGSFIDLTRKNPEKAAELMPVISRNIQFLIQDNIHHVDLHPGNIILNGDGIPHIIDFDKACFTYCATARLKSRYEKRWNRAVAKHRLSSQLLLLKRAETDPPWNRC